MCGAWTCSECLRLGTWECEISMLVESQSLRAYIPSFDCMVAESTKFANL